METIEEAINAVLESKADVGEALVTKFGIQEQDIVEDGEITSSGLKDEEGNWKRLSEWKTVINNTNVDADTVDGKHASEFADISELSEVATSGSYNDLCDKPNIPVLPDWVTTKEPDYIKYSSLNLSKDLQLLARYNIKAAKQLPFMTDTEAANISNSFITENKNIQLSLSSGPGVYNYLGTIASIYFTDPMIPKMSEEIIITFTTSNTEPCTLTLPADTNIVGDIELKRGTSYVISILNGIFVMGELNASKNEFIGQ